MKRSTVRLINAVAYRRSLARDLPDLEARLRAELRDGQTLRTTKWIVTKQLGRLIILVNDSPPRLREIPLDWPGV